MQPRKFRMTRQALGLLLAGGLAVAAVCWWRTRPTAAEADYRRGRDLQAIGMTAEAQAAYLTATKQDPHYAPPYRALAEMAVSHGDAPTAVKYWKAFLARSPRAPHAWCRLAQMEALLHLEVPAMHDAEQELKLDPQCPRAHLVIGILDATVSEAKRALDHLAVAAHAYPDKPQVQLVYAKVLALCGDYGQAEPLLQSILKQDSSHADPYLWLGYISARRVATPTNVRQAEDYLRHALTLEPQHPEANFELGRLYVGQRRYKEALPLLQSAVSHKRHYVGALFALAQAQTALGQQTQAAQTQAVFQRESDMAEQEKALLKLYVVDTQNVTTLLSLGRLEIARQEPEAALLFLRDAAQRAPQDDRVRSALEQAGRMQVTQQTTRQIE